MRALGGGAVILAFACAATASADTIVSKEYQVKAAFLYNMPKFIEWPAERFADASAPIVIGILGANPFGDQLDLLVKDRKINGHPVTIKAVQSVEDARTTHVLFVGEREDAHFSSMASALQAVPVLTVGESAAFLEMGGIIRFVPVEDKLRFEINMSSAERAQIKMSAQLQKLATSIRRAP